MGLGEFRAEAPLELDEHGHDEVHVCLVLEGRMWERVSARERLLQPGDVRVSPPGDRHRIRFGERGCRCLLLFVPEDVVEEPAEGVVRRPRFLRAPGLRSTAGELLEQLHRPDAASPLVVETGALEVVAQTTRRWRDDIASGPPRWLRDAADALDGAARLASTGPDVHWNAHDRAGVRRRYRAPA